MIKCIAFTCSLVFIAITLVNAQNLARFSDIKAGMKDDGLEHQAMRIANERAAGLHWAAVYKKAKIISHKWEIILGNNDLLAGRKIHMELYCVKPDGNCVIADFTFKQKYIDGEYQDRLICIKVGELFNVDCE